MLVIKQESKPILIEKEVIDEGLEYAEIKSDMEGVIDDRDNSFDITIPVTVEIRN